MDALIQDLRYGIRQLFRQRGSSIVAVLTLALGIGASTAIFSVIDATMLRPLPYPDPEQLVRVHPEEIQPDGQVSQSVTVHGGHAHLAGGRRCVLRGRGLGRRLPRPHHRRAATRAHPGRCSSPRITCRCTASRRSSAGISCATIPNRSAPLVALLGYGYWQSHFRRATRTSSARPSVSTPTSPPSSACCRRGSTRRRRCRYRCEFLRGSFRVEAPGASPCMPAFGRT